MAPPEHEEGGCSPSQEGCWTASHFQAEDFRPLLSVLGVGPLRRGLPRPCPVLGMWPLRPSRAGVLGTASCRFKTSSPPLAPTGPRQRPPPAADRLQPHFIDLVALGLRWFLIKTTLRLMVSCRLLSPACLLLFWSPCGLSLQLRRRRSALSYRPCSLLVLRCCSSLFKTWLLLWRVGLLKSQAYGNLWKLSGAAKTLPMLNLLLLLWPLVRIVVRLLWLAAQLS